MSEEKRKHPRTPTQEEAQVIAGDQTLDATITDLSIGGMGIEFGFDLNAAQQAFDIGNEVEVAPKAGDKRVGRVVRQYINGLGLQFGAPEQKT